MPAEQIGSAREVQGDGGLLFALGLVVLAAAPVALWLHRGQLPLGRRGRGA